MLLDLRWEQEGALNWWLGLEVSGEEGRVDSALRAETGLDLEELSLKLRLDLLGPTLGDRAGIGLYSSLAPLDFLSALLYLGYHTDNVAREPAISTVATLEALVDTSLELGTELPTFRFRGRGTQQGSDGLNPEVNRAEWSWHLSLAQPLGDSALYLAAATTRETDWVAGTRYEDQDYEERLSLALGGMRLLFRLTQDLRRDLIADEVVESAYVLELESDFREPRLSLLLQGALQEEGIGFGLKLRRFSRTLDLGLTVEAALAAALELSLTLGMTTRFDLPLPLLKTKGRVEGYIFIDELSLIHI